jgi:hypothetical protein
VDWIAVVTRHSDNEMIEITHGADGLAILGGIAVLQADAHRDHR